MLPKLSPDHRIEGLNDVTVCDFWAWAYSDILSNRNRSIFAEFLAGLALGITDNSRIEWDAIDLRYKTFKIEVKSAAYLQSWEQKKVSNIRFDISKKKAWDAFTNEYSKDFTRFSDCFVFCLYTERDKNSANVLDTGKWDFYVVLTNDLESKFKDQKSIALSRIQKICEPVKFSNLKNRIDEVLAKSSTEKENVIF